MWIRAFFNPARRVPVLCLLCLIFFGFIRPVRALQRAEEAEAKAIPLTYANLCGVTYRQTAKIYHWLDTGKVEKSVLKGQSRDAMKFTDQPTPGGSRYWLYLGSVARVDYVIADENHIRVGADGFFRVRLTATTLTLTQRNAEGTMDFTSIYEQEAP